MFVTSVLQATPSQPADYTPQFIGIIGTLLGVFLGWLLSYFTNNKGKIKIFMDNAVFSKSEHRQFAYIIQLSIYNNSLKQRSIRETEIHFIENQQTVYKEIPRQKEDNSKFVGISLQEEVCIANLKPFEYKTINICGIIEGDNYNRVSRANKVMLYYQNEKKRRHCVKIENKFSLKSVSTNHDVKKFD